MFYDILTSLRLQAENLLPSDPFEITGSRFITLSSELKPVIKPASVIGEKIFYWSKPASHQTLIASGTLLSFVTKGSNRFKEITEDLTQPGGHEYHPFRKPPGGAVPPVFCYRIQELL